MPNFSNLAFFLSRLAFFGKRCFKPNINFKQHTTFYPLSHTPLFLAFQCRLLARSDMPTIRFIVFGLKKVCLLLVFMVRVKDEQEHMPTFEILGWYNMKTLAGKIFILCKLIIMKE